METPFPGIEIRHVAKKDEKRNLFLKKRFSETMRDLRDLKIKPVFFLLAEMGLPFSPGSYIIKLPLAVSKD